jgi:hypothetical protein
MDEDLLDQIEGNFIHICPNCQSIYDGIYCYECGLDIEYHKTKQN